jgi:hypothetical protein
MDGLVRVEILKMSVFWDVARCSLVEFTDVSETLAASGTRATMIMEAAGASKTSVNFYQTTRFNIPEESDLHTRRRENLKSQEQ